MIGKSMGSKYLRRKKIYIMARKEYKQQKDKRRCYIVDNTVLQVEKDPKSDQEYLMIDGNAYRFCKPIGYIKGYVQISEDRYVAVRSRWILLLFVLLSLGITTAMAATLLTAPPKEDKTLSWQDNGEQLEVEIPETDGEVHYTVIKGLNDMTVTKDTPYIPLINAAESGRYMSFDVYEGNDLLGSTEVIPPGRQINFNVFEKLPAGDHEISVFHRTYDVDGEKQLNTIETKMIVSVVK